VSCDVRQEGLLRADCCFVRILDYESDNARALRRHGLQRHRFWSLRIGRSYVALVMIICAALMTIMVVGYWRGRPVTRFAIGFKGHEFRTLTPGTSAPDVVKRVGQPLAFLVQRPAVGGKVEWERFDFVSVPHLLKECEGDAGAQLIYSWHGKAGRSFEVYVVHLEGQKVVGTGIYQGGGD
jgi:hypothetical protein